MELTEDQGPVRRRRSRLALWGILAVVALVAGVGAVLVADSDEATVGPPLPIALGSAAGGEDAGQTLAAPEADAAGAADMTMAVWATYVAGEGLPALGGTGTAYRVVGDLDEARVAQLAAAVGLEGTPEQISEVDGWRVEEPGVGLLEAYPWGGGSWWFNLTSASGGVVSSDGSTGVAVAEEPVSPDADECTAVSDDGQSIDTCQGGGVSGSPGSAGSAGSAGADPGCADGEECEVPPAEPEPVPPPVEPQPAADLPSQDEAEQIARDLYAAAGGAYEIVEVVADGPYDSWYVTLRLGVAGQAVSGLEWTVGVGPDGVIQSAGGSLGHLEELGSYDLIDTTAAIERLNEQMGGFGDTPMPMPAEDVPVAVEDATSTTYVEECGTTPDGGQYCEGFEGTGEPVEDPPPDCTPDPKCGGVPDDPSTSGCVVQPDGSEICQTEPSAGGEPSDGTQPTCKPQPDGREICEIEPSGGGEPSDGTEPTCKPQPDGSEICQIEPGGDSGDVPACDTPDATTIPPADADPETPVSSECTTPDTVVIDPMPQPVPTEPQEIVLTGAEPALLLMPSFDGVDNYIVPAYRFTGDEGVEVYTPAVADDAIEPTPPPSTETTVPQTLPPETLPPETLAPETVPTPAG